MNLSNDEMIFVQIPSFLDSELCPTLRNLFATAAHPHRLRVVVLWQHDEDDVIDADLLAIANLEFVAVDARLSEGPNWARRQIRELWDGEQYTLMLDSHHRFVAGWDQQLIQMHRRLGTSALSPNKAILTAYLTPYCLDRPQWNCTPRALRLLPHEWDEGVLTRLVGWPIAFSSELRKPVPAEFVSYHFLFGPGTLNAESGLAALDDIYFFGDEVVLGLLLLTMGYELFHPHLPLGWHAYDRNQRQPHWTRSPNWIDRQRASLALVRSMIVDAGTDRSPISRAAVEQVEQQAMVRLVESSGP